MISFLLISNVRSVSQKIDELEIVAQTNHVDSLTVSPTKSCENTWVALNQKRLRPAIALLSQSNKSRLTESSKRFPVGLTFQFELLSMLSNNYDLDFPGELPSPRR